MPLRMSRTRKRLPFKGETNRSDTSDLVRRLTREGGDLLDYSHVSRVVGQIVKFHIGY